MALVADNPKERAEQLILLTERLASLIAIETQRIEAREPPLDGEEKTRLANAYRLELVRIKHEPALLDGAPPPMLDHLRRSTVVLHETLDAHELALHAVKVVSEGLVHAMAEEVLRQRGGDANYAASGALATPTAPGPALLDRSA